MIHIAVTCCLVATALAAPQGRYLPPSGGYGSRNANSIVQGSALPRRFSVSKTSAQPNKYPSSGGQYPGAGSGQYNSGGESQYQTGGAQYQGAGSGRYGGEGQSGYGGDSQYRNGGAQYATEDPYSEPANYDFSYEVNAPEYNVLFGHQESRRDMFAKGSYKVLLPDGRTQLVEYEADEEGYRPTVTYQAAAGGRVGYSQGGNYAESARGGAGAYGQGGYGGSGNGGFGDYAQHGHVTAGNGGYSQNGNGVYATKIGGAGKGSYSQDSNAYSGNQNYGNNGNIVSGGYQGPSQGQGYRY